ncbi:MAG: hypothetical protein QM484_02135 [Woeseiaceae bacterium]
MNKYLIPILILGMLTLNGCARHAQIIIDPKGVDMGLYHQDLADCQHLADQVESKVGEGIVTGAVVGALFGSIFGTHRSTVRIAKFGALSGGLSAGGAEKYEREKVIKNCLLNRGYQILN